MKTRLAILTSILIFSCYQAHSQKKATTDDGKNVLLNENGTWKYDTLLSTTPDTGKVLSFNKPETSRQLKKSDKIDAGVWYNEHKWNVKAGTSSDAYEYLFTQKSGDLYAMFISERIEVPMDELVSIGRSNAEKVSTDFVFQEKGKRIINGKEMRYAQFKCKVRGIDCQYLVYYYSQDGMTIQFLGYTSQKLFAGSKRELESMLNGLAIIDKK